ncbi:hypothetical protein [Hymenobacter psychrotolerans]|uniref:Uncharacterized protein n=1 Tax=Hymenobacter psychrotolerans DSM 18569 TaxID=1121959 RepID=A0A1M6XDU8_9BACT|nr:hypothetical protein [Hymenobacter psychrotolerans]SHL04132.1 hypothetical protein SAMN02746009_02015 [Hymenobacter psychrotolerans DSM 18569]
MVKRTSLLAALAGIALALSACDSNSSNAGGNAPLDTDANGSADINGYDAGPDSAAANNAGAASTRGDINANSGGSSDDGNGMGTGPTQGGTTGSGTSGTSGGTTGQ